MPFAGIELDFVATPNVHRNGTGKLSVSGFVAEPLLNVGFLLAKRDSASSNRCCTDVQSEPLDEGLEEDALPPPQPTTGSRTQLTLQEDVGSCTWSSNPHTHEP